MGPESTAVAADKNDRTRAVARVPVWAGVAAAAAWPYQFWAVQDWHQPAGSTLFCGNSWQP